MVVVQLALGILVVADHSDVVVEDNCWAVDTVIDREEGHFVVDIAAFLAENMELVEVESFVVAVRQREAAVDSLDLVVMLELLRQAAALDFAAHMAMELTLKLAELVLVDLEMLLAIVDLIDLC